MRNNIAKVISLPDETGSEPMYDYLSTLSKSAISSLEDKIKREFISQSLGVLELVDKSRLPSNGDFLSAVLTIDIDGKPYSKSLKLVKSLKRQPIYELRISLEELNWHFRATFFPKYHAEQLFYCFIDPFVKVETEEDPTNYYRDKAYRIFEDVKSDPDKYFNK